MSPATDLPPAYAGPAGLDVEVAYQALVARDRRFDGRLWFGVTSTGVYCRPVCPAQTPKITNVRYFAAPAAAVSAGFRACKRCRPDSAPGSRHWDHRGDLASRALRLIADGAVDEGGVVGLAASLHVDDGPGEDRRASPQGQLAQPPARHARGPRQVRARARRVPGRPHGLLHGRRDRGLRSSRVRTAPAI